MSAAELVDPTLLALACDRLSSSGGGAAVVVDLRDEPNRTAPEGLDARLRSVPRVLMGLTGTTTPGPPGTVAAALDVAAADADEAAEVAASVAAHPLASASLVLLLRSGGDLVAESATYSALQAGPEHRGWLSSRPPRREGVKEAASAVRVERRDRTLTLTLDRPHVRNAFDARMREELLAGLLVAVTDASVEEVVVRGDGPAFCSGGDLDEFGTAADPASAHVLRVGRSVGRVLEALSSRVVVRLHGACVGAGVELPAFAGRVVAAPDASFRLPEVAMGLVPGAGGTVSIPRRIGRQRTAWMALTGRAVDAETALAWGLVDEIE